MVFFDKSILLVIKKKKNNNNNNLWVEARYFLLEGVGTHAHARKSQFLQLKVNCSYKYIKSENSFIFWGPLGQPESPL